MKKNLFWVVIALFSLIELQSCQEEKTIETSRVQLKLVDAPGDYQEVNIEIIDIQYNSSDDEGGWSSFTPEGGYPINVDLTELVGGNDLLLADEVISEEMLKQIRLVLSNNNTLLLEGEVMAIPLDTPSAQQSGLKLKLDTELEPGFSYTFILDWNVQKSIVKAGNSGKYILKPVIRVSTEVNSGSIAGKVKGEVQGDDIDGAVPLEGVIVEIYDAQGDYITESGTDENGNFLIQGIDQGDYSIRIEDNHYIIYESDKVINVTVGNVSDAGIIELQVPVS